MCLQQDPVSKIQTVGYIRYFRGCHNFLCTKMIYTLSSRLALLKMVNKRFNSLLKQEEKSADRSFQK